MDLESKKFSDKLHSVSSVSNGQTNFRIKNDRTNYSNKINVVVKGISRITLLDIGA